MLAWLGLSAQQVYEAGERLLIAADFMDLLSDWCKLIRFGRRDRWDKLKGEALLALDHRIAGEMLLRFHEDLAARGSPPLQILQIRGTTIPVTGASLRAKPALNPR
jgi:hypothetical protein